MKRNLQLNDYSGYKLWSRKWYGANAFKRTMQKNRNQERLSSQLHSSEASGKDCLEKLQVSASIMWTRLEDTEHLHMTDITSHLNGDNFQQ